VGLKMQSVATQGQASAALVAIGAIGKGAAASKALLDQFGVHRIVNQVSRSGNQRACLLLWQVAATVAGRGIELQRLRTGGCFGIIHATLPSVIEPLWDARASLASWGRA